MIMSSEEEVDYMSEDFLKQCEATSLKTSLIKDKNKQRKIETERRQEERREQQKMMFSKQSKAELEIVNRKVGLETSISTESKGFAMLQKMGYKAGSGLGKTGEGRVELVPIEIKADRGGLGRVEALRKVQERKQAMQEEHHKATLRKYSDVEEFRALQRQRLNAKLDYSDLAKSQAACEKLDIEHDIEEPAETWFWRSTAVAKVADSEEDDQLGPLRKRKRRLLPSEVGYEDEEIGSEEDSEEIEKVELSVPEKLELLTQYLRLVYSYCVWCGVTYANLTELQDSCPGNNRSDH